MKIQLPLSFHFIETLSFDNFLVSNNLELIRALKMMVSHPGPQSIFIWGKNGSGRSHLCQALYQYAEYQQQNDEESKVAYLALSEENIQPDVLGQFENFDLIILDDIDAVLGKEHWDEALFHFYNRHKESSGRLLMTSSVAPASFEAVLPDLKSRLGWELVYQLDELSDADKIQALQQRANERGLKLSVEVGQFLLTRLPRDTHQLFSILEKLDHQSLAQKRSLTIPFVKNVLNL